MAATRTKQIHLQHMEDHNQPLEVRLIGSSWTLEVYRNNGLILGYITAASAKTYRYDINKYNGVEVDDPASDIVPTTVFNRLCAMMRKWNRINMKAGLSGEMVVTVPCREPVEPMFSNDLAGKQ